MKTFVSLVLMSSLLSGCTSVNQQRGELLSVASRQHAEPAEIIFELGFGNHVASVQIEDPTISSTFRLKTDDSTGVAGQLSFMTANPVVTFTILAWQQELPVKKSFTARLKSGRFIAISKTESGFVMQQYIEPPVYD